MYHRILVAIENSAADRTIITHVTQLARLTGAGLSVHGGRLGRPAFRQLKLRESEEMKADRAYLEQLRDLASQGLTSKRVWRWATYRAHPRRARSAVDLIAMSTHVTASCPTSAQDSGGSRRHLVKIPVLLRAQPSPRIAVYPLWVVVDDSP